MFAATSGHSDGLPAKLIAGATLMHGVEGSVDALMGMCGCMQLEQQHLQQHASDMKRCSKHMQDASSEASSLLSDAVAALESARSALDVAVFKCTMRQQSPDNPKVSARRAAYDAEACAFLNAVACLTHPSRRSLAFVASSYTSNASHAPACGAAAAFSPALDCLQLNPLPKYPKYAHHIYPC